MIDYKNPEYTPIFEHRQNMLKELRASPIMFNNLKVHYRDNPWEFINDWGMTFDPRNIEDDISAHIPFILWPRQIEFLKWLRARWKAKERGLVDKSRDCGVTWLSVGFAINQFLFEPGFVMGFASRKEELVDKLGDDRSIFEKLRYFLDHIPTEFLPFKWDINTCSAQMRLRNPDTCAAIIGECGDEIGRGGRTSLYCVDEAAFISHQERIDAALSQNTNCQIDISTINGSGNLFYKKRMRFDKTDKVFLFNWKQDPRKDDAWYQKQLKEHDDATIGSEINQDPAASEVDSFIPAKWVEAAIDAHVKLGFHGQGIRVTGFDPADVGDAKAVVNRWGSVILEADQITRGNITKAIPWAFEIAEDFRAEWFSYDADGMGAPSLKVYLDKMTHQQMKMVAYHGSGGVVDPKKPFKKVRREKAAFRRGSLRPDRIKCNADMYLNYRAQTWALARARFEATYNAVTRCNDGLLINADPDDLISISSKCKFLRELQSELSRPKRIYHSNGKVKVESKRDMKARGISSPNLSDACIIALSVTGATQKPKLNIKYNEWQQSVPGVI